MAEAHIRIDEGIARGPRPAKNPHKLKSPKADLGTWVIPKDLDPDEVLAEYLAAHTTSSIAARYGLSRKALVGWLREQRPEQWKRVQVLRALIRKEDGDEQIETAPDALSLARARELLKSAQFDLERLDPNTWGQKQEINTVIDHRVIIEHSLGESALTLFESMRGITVDQPALDKPETEGG